jgi:hypothetical protein
LLAGGQWDGVHGDVPLQWVHRRRPWRGTPAVIGGDAVGNHGGVAGGVATAVSTIVVVLAVTTAVVAVVVSLAIVVVAVTVARAAAIVLARGGEATIVEQTTFCWSRMLSEQQLDWRCPGGFPPSWYPPGCGG